jgi:gliding motility-associated-like protein
MMKSKKPYLAFLVVIIFFCKANAQQFNSWIFHNNNGLNFNTSPPSFLAGGQISLNFPTQSEYSTSSISDNNGNLLFYSDGERVWNKNHQLMPNGFGLLGGEGQINTALIVPFVNDTSKYYLFISKGLTNITPGAQNTYPYSYNIIDMNLNGGLGDVTNKNTIIKYFGTEKMVAIPNANGSDIWWICRDWTNSFYSYKINCTGFQNSNPVISNIGFDINNDNSLLSRGDIKASPDGNFIACAYREYFELYRFNKATGVLSNPIFIPGRFYPMTGSECVGVEFSPNSKVLYITERFFNPVNNGSLGSITQYNLSTYDSTAIENSRYIVRIDGGEGFGDGGLQLGPDNKIYHNDAGNYIDIINKPNIVGIGCNYQDSVILLPNDAFARFPYSYVNLITAQNVQISYTVAPDCRTVTFTGKTFIKGNNLTFKWKWGEPPPVGGTAADSATQVVASQGDTTFTSITHTYPLGVDTFFASLIVSSDTVCGTGKATTKVLVRPPRPTANFGFTSTCNNLNVAFTDSSLLNTNPSITYQYAYKLATAAPGSFVNFSTLANNNFTFASYDSFDVRLIVTSPLSCVQNDTIIKRIVLKAKPVAGFTYTNNCGSLQANITSTANITAGNIVLQQYYLNNNLIGTGNSFNYIFANYGSFLVKHIVKSNFNCISDTTSVNIIIKAKPTLNLTTLRDSVCVGSSYSITANSTVAASTINNYTWVKNNIVQANNSNIFTANDAVGTYNYKVITTAANTCKSDTAFKTITVVSKPTASINASNSCGSKQINILASTSVINDNITSYYVSYGDGNTSTTNPNNTNYTYTNFGSYALKLVAKSSIGCNSDTAFFNVVVKDKPTLNLTTLRDSVCVGSSYSITANSTVAASTINNYTWIKNNIVQANNSNSFTANDAVGTYNYKVITTAANTCKSDTAFKTINVVSKPTATINASNICGSKQINILASASVINDNITSYYISYGDGNTSTTNPNNTTYSYTNFGSYTIKLVAKSSIGCNSDTAFFNVVVKDKPTAGITYTNNACANTNFTLLANASVNASSINNYIWLRNNVVLPNNTSTLAQNLPSGNYMYKLIATAAQGCKSDTIYQNVTVQNLPTAAFTATNGCVGNAITITNNSNSNGSGTITYAWLTSNGQTSTAVTPSFSFVTSGTKTITLTATTSNGCASTIQNTITIDDYATANFNITEACLGKVVLIENNSVGNIVNYTWQTSNGQASTAAIPNFIFNAEGNYQINLTANTANNCSNSSSKSVTIKAVALQTTSDTIIAINQPLALNITGAQTYLWQPTTYLNNAQSSTPVFTTAQQGIYVITAVGTTAQGCKGNAQVNIKVIKANSYLLLPNTFTPNADNLNDVFRPTCAGLKQLTSFVIFNRFGQKVYEQAGCQGTRGWDGSYKGVKQNTGAFVYQWAGIDFNGKPAKGEGTVLLVR